MSDQKSIDEQYNFYYLKNLIDAQNKKIEEISVGYESLYNKCGELSVKLNLQQSSLREFEKQRIEPQFKDFFEMFRAVNSRLENLEKHLHPDSILPTLTGITYRLEMLENFNDSHAKLIAHSQNGIEKTFERIEKLEEPKDCHLAADVKRLEKTLDDLITKIADIGNYCYREKQTPHKCPVCEGSGRYRLATAQRLDDVIDCRTCDGKGIVWG